MDDTNLTRWTPIGDAPPLAANGTIVSAEHVSAEHVSTEHVSAEHVSTERVSTERGDATQAWQPATTGPHGSAGAQGDQAAANSNASSNWTPALGPTPHASQTPTPGIVAGITGPAGTTGTATLGKTEEVRHGGPFSKTAWRWSLVAVAAIIGLVVLIELGLSRFIDQFESGTPQRLAVICASLFSNDLVMIGVLIVAAKRLGMSFRSFGIRRPADVKESIVLAFAAWLIFILLAGVWAMVSQSAAEREANNPFLRDKTVNARDSSISVPGPDSSATGSTDGSDAAPHDTSSASKNSSDTVPAKAGSTEESGFSEDASTGKAKATTKPADQTTASKSKDVADNRHALIKVLNDDPPKALLISILITGCIGAPLLEELLVRGFMFGAFSQRFGKLAGGAISSLLFGFAHIMAYPLKMIPPLVLMGAALAWLAWQTGSIVPGMFIHAFVNSLGLGIAASLGGHILTLMVGSWIVLTIILLPWIRKKLPTTQAGS